MNTVGIDRLGFLIHDTARLLRKRFEARGSEHGLSSAQWRAMARIVKEEGLPQARLAEVLEIEPISVSRLLDRMEEGGWIERRADQKDRRVRMVFPTAKSRDVYSAIKAVASEVYEDALAGISGADRTILINALNQIVENLSENNLGGDAATMNAKDQAA